MASSRFFSVLLKLKENASTSVEHVNQVLYRSTYAVDTTSQPVHCCSGHRVKSCFSYRPTQKIQSHHVAQSCLQYQFLEAAQLQIRDC